MNRNNNTTKKLQVNRGLQPPRFERYEPKRFDRLFCDDCQHLPTCNMHGETEAASCPRFQPLPTADEVLP